MAGPVDGARAERNEVGIVRLTRHAPSTSSNRPLVTPLSRRDMGVRRLAVDEVLANRVRSGTKQP